MNIYQTIARCETSPTRYNLHRLRRYALLKCALSTCVPTSMSCVGSCTILTINNKKDLLVVNNGPLAVIAKLINHICCCFSHYRICTTCDDMIKITFITHKTKYTKMLFEYCTLSHHYGLETQINMNFFGNYLSGQVMKYPLHDYLIDLFKKKSSFTIESFRKRNTQLTIS
mgnify:CR=1 FL=1